MAEIHRLQDEATDVAEARGHALTTFSEPEEGYSYAKCVRCSRVVNVTDNENEREAIVGTAYTEDCEVSDER